jgi:hypothetical protein
MERVEQAVPGLPEGENGEAVMTKKKSEPDRAGLISAVGRRIGFSPKAEIDEQLPPTGRVIPPSRMNKVGILTHHDKAVAHQLKALALREGTTQQKLMAEALNLLFVKYRVNQIAQ